MKKRKIRDYVVPELNVFREQCNFTEDELTYFECKVKDYTDVKIAEIMDIATSQVSKLSSRVREKISIVESYNN